jgi:hypothetical protein
MRLLQRRGLSFHYAIGWLGTVNNPFARGAETVLYRVRELANTPEFAKAQRDGPGVVARGRRAQEGKKQHACRRQAHPTQGC